MNFFSLTYWTIFFSAYWTAFQLGEKKTPQVNASWFMILISMVNMFSIINFLTLLIGNDYSFFPVLISISSLIVIFLNIYVLFLSKKNYKKRAKDFEKLSLSNKTRFRITTLLFVFLITFIILMISSLLNNPQIKKEVFGLFILPLSGNKN